MALANGITNGSYITRRQLEMADALDLTKNQAPQQLEAASPHEPSFVESDTNNLKED